MLNLLFTTTHLKSSQFGCYVCFLCYAEEASGFYRLRKSEVREMNKKINNGVLDQFEEFLNLPGILYDDKYVYFNSHEPMPKARSIDVDEKSLLYIYNKYSLAGLKIYCQLMWVDKLQRKTNQLSPFYYKSVNTLLNIPNASYIMQQMRRDKIIEYGAAEDEGHLKKLTRVNSIF